MSIEQAVDAAPAPANPPRLRSFDRSTETGLWALLKDFGAGLLKYRLWLNFAREEIRQRFHGSWLGVAWFAVSFLVFVLAIALYFRALEGRELLYVALGMAVYQYVVSNLGDGCNVFVASVGWIQGARIPYSVYIYKSLARSILPFLIHIVLCAGMYGYAWYEVGFLPPASAWLALPIFFVLLLNGVWVQFLFGVINARFRDLQHLVNAITRLLFFTTPILWSYEDTTGLRRVVADINPITHFVQVFRAPMLDDPIDPLHWYVVGGLTLGGWLVMLLVVGANRHRLPTWLE